MTEQLVTNLSPPEPFTYTGPLDGLSAVEEMIFKYKMDVIYDPAITSRRRRIEWPALDSTLEDIYSNMIGDAQASDQEDKYVPKAITTATVQEIFWTKKSRNATPETAQQVMRMYLT